MNSAESAGGVFPFVWRRRNELRPWRVALAVLAWCGATLGALAQPEPVIDDFTPRAGTPGDEIQVSGSGFSTGFVQVYFWNGVPGVATVTSDTLMRVLVPAGATTGPLGIKRDAGSVTYSAADFFAIGPGPFITDFAPAYGSTNDLVTINGVHFAGVAANGVKFGNVRATDAFPNGDGTQISVHVPYGAAIGSAPISVTTGFGTSNSLTAFTVIGPGPYITGFSPDHGPAGTRVLIDGVHFTGATQVTFNSLQGANFAVRSDSLIQVDAPANVKTGPMTIYSPLSNATTVAYFYVAPSITGLSPSSGRSGTNVTITGLNFRGATAVLFNGIQAAFTIVNNTNIQATVPAGVTTGQVRINTPYFSCFSPNSFTVKPTIYGFTPNFGPPLTTSVTITGANFNVGTPVVWFNGAKAATPTGVTFSRLTAVVPSAATTGPISITTSDGSHTNMNNFYVPAAITSFTPTNSPPGSRITITGQNFIDAASVNFNGMPAAGFTVSNNTTIGATVPNGVATGPLTISTPAGSTTSARLFYGAPLITSFLPTAGLPGTSVTIQGTNFLGATSVRFGALAAPFNVVDNGRITATVPANALTGPITIQAPAGTNTTATSFLIDYPSDLEVWITAAPDPVMASSNLVYSVTMINHGPFDAPNVRLTNTLPASVTFVSASMAPGWTVSSGSNLVVATIPNVAVGGTSTLNINAVPHQPGAILDSATIASDRTDPVPANNSFTLSTYVLPLPVLSIRWWTNQVRVSWPVALTNYFLESNTNLIDSAWTSNAIPPLPSGIEQFVIESNTVSSKFYRLHKQVP